MMLIMLLAQLAFNGTFPLSRVKP